MSRSDQWDINTVVEFDVEALISLVQVEQNHSLGRVHVTDDTVTTGDSPWHQFNWHGAHYTLVYRIISDSETIPSAGELPSEGPYTEEGYCIAPYLNNRLRFTLPQVLIYHPLRNELHKSDATGNFIPHSRALAADLDAWRGLRVERIGIDNGVNNSAAYHERSALILEDIENRRSHYACLNREDRLRAVIFACHGFTNGVQLGFAMSDDQAPPGESGETRRARTERLMDTISEMSRTDVKIILYACSTGAPNGARQGSDSDLRPHYGWWRAMMEAARDYSPHDTHHWPDESGDEIWGRTSFADYLRSGLHSRGCSEVEVIGHSEVADAFRFPFALRFSGGQEGGQWVVDPGAENNFSNARAFRNALWNTSLKFRYPWMNREEIMEQLEAD